MTKTLKLTNKDLQKFGYYIDISPNKRFTALVKAVQYYSPYSILQYLQYLQKSKNKSNKKSVEQDIERVVDEFLMNEHRASRHHGFPYMWLYSEIVHNAKEYEEYGDTFYIDNVLICFDKIVSSRYKVNNYYDKKTILRMSKLLNSKKFEQLSKLGVVRVRKLRNIFATIQLQLVL